jgi:hypothetical protein
MSDLAAHLVDRVIPDVPVRQWVLSLPFPLRFPLAYDPELGREVKGLFIRAVMGWTRRRAAAQGIHDGRTGAIVATQLCDSALRVSPHFHAIVLDGVFTDLGPGRTPRFCAIAPPTDDDVARLVRTIHGRVRSLLRRRRRLLEGDFAPDHQERPSVRDLCLAAAVQGRIALGADAGSHPGRMRRYPDTSPRRLSSLSAVLEGFSLHGGVAFGSGETTRPTMGASHLRRPTATWSCQSLTKKPTGTTIASHAKDTAREPQATAPSFPAGSRAGHALRGPTSCAGCSGTKFCAAPAAAAATC